MNKLTVGILGIVSCLLLLTGLLVALFSVMDAISLGLENLWRMAFALPFLAAGARLYILLDRECDERKAKQVSTEP